MNRVTWRRGARVLNSVVTSGALAVPPAVRLPGLRPLTSSHHQPSVSAAQCHDSPIASFVARWTSVLRRGETLKHEENIEMPCTKNAASRRLPDLAQLPAVGILLLAIAFAPVNGFAQGVYTQTYLPSAFGTSAFVGNTVLVGQT